MSLKNDGPLRDEKGRWLERGGPGPGVKPLNERANYVRQAFVDAFWDPEVDGPAKLRELAKEDPDKFLKQVVSVLPKQVESKTELVDRRPTHVLRFLKDVPATESEVVPRNGNNGNGTDKAANR